MLKIFRTIRKKLIEPDNVRKYLLYAIGEILLVVIGILIALQVNNWNEARKEARTTETILENLLIDVKEDLNNLESLKEMLSSRKEDADYLLNIINNPDIAIDNTRTVVALTRVGWILNYTPIFATYNEITHSGRLSLIQSVELKKRLADYKSQIEDNRRIEASYEPGLKEAERLALSFLERVPEASNLFSSSVPEEYGEIGIDLMDMKENDLFIGHLKHISYHTATEILYKDNLIIPRANAIKEALEQLME